MNAQRKEKAWSQKNIAPIRATSRFFVVNYKNMKVYCSCIELLLLLFKSRATRFVALYWNEFESQSCKELLQKSLKNQLDSNFFPSLQQRVPRVIKLITNYKNSFHTTATNWSSRNRCSQNRTYITTIS